jgi:hypothetical protein
MRRDLVGRSVSRVGQSSVRMPELAGRLSVRITQLRSDARMLPGVTLIYARQ